MLYVILLPCKENLGQFLNGLGLSEIKWAKNTETLKKLGINLPCDQAIPLPGIHPEKATVLKDTCTPVFIAALFTITRTWKQPRCPSTDELIKKMWYIYTMEYYSPIKKSKFEPFHLVSALSLVLRPHACIPPWKHGALFQFLPGSCTKWFLPW